MHKFIFLVFFSFVSLPAFGFDKQAMNNSGLLFIKFDGGDLYYVDGGKTACLPTEKLKLVLLKYNDCISEYSKLKVDFDSYIKIKELELDKIKKQSEYELNLYKSMCENCDRINFFKSVLFVGGGFVLGFIFTSIGFIFLYR